MDVGVFMKLLGVDSSEKLPDSSIKSLTDSHYLVHIVPVVWVTSLKLSASRRSIELNRFAILLHRLSSGISSNSLHCSIERPLTALIAFTSHRSASGVAAAVLPIWPSLPTGFRPLTIPFKNSFSPTTLTGLSTLILCPKSAS
ncbi:hypothetical protein L6452_08276 [Arctium lappa]|uniref:Uncharacterized protein n=1 Tax=Arctium lappa TaxID=4217 RepID=A0ACB9DH94_ARCLA|nr:hypothetical protein L6452_08276 [Arctium lappa]